MVTKCANSSCSAGFRYLRGGRLFLFEVSQGPPMSGLSSSESGFRKSEFRSSEYFWLSEECAKSMTINSDESGRAFVGRTRKGA